MKPRTKSLIVGIAAGAAIGAIFGWIIGDGEENASRTVQVGGLSTLGPGDYLKIGIAVLALAREFNGMIRQQ